MEELLKTEFINEVTYYNLAIIAHLFGLALGAGAAFYSDFLFMHIMKDKKVTSDELKILKLTSKVVWLGLIVLLISGLVIFSGNSERLLDSPKFFAKMSIIGILALNGILFHIKYIPLLSKNVGKKLSTNKKFESKSRGFFISGAISGVSWASAIVLGSLRISEYSYALIMSLYAAALVVASFAALNLHKKFFSN